VATPLQPPVTPRPAPRNGCPGRNPRMSDDRKFSQRFSIKCVYFEVCARRPPPHFGSQIDSKQTVVKSAETEVKMMTDGS